MNLTEPEQEQKVFQFPRDDVAEHEDERFKEPVTKEAA